MSRFHEKTAAQIEAIRQREANRLKLSRAVQRCGPAYQRIPMSMEAMPKGEMVFPGGVFEEGCEANDRADVALILNNPVAHLAVPLTLDLRIDTGSVTVSLMDCLPEDIVRLGRWLIETASPLVEPVPAVVQGAD